MDGYQSPEHVENSLSTLETGVTQQTAQVADDLTELGDSIEQTAIAEVKEQLGRLETAVDRIPSPAPSPKTTLQLQNQADVKGAWQNYLQYFLNPDAHYGLGKDALFRFLRGLDDVGAQEFPHLTV